jgi:hypothetical protein
MDTNAPEPGQIHLKYHSARSRQLEPRNDFPKLKAVKRCENEAHKKERSARFRSLDVTIVDGIFKTF